MIVHIDLSRCLTLDLVFVLNSRTLCVRATLTRLNICYIVHRLGSFRYEAKGKKFAKERNTGLPPGLTPEAWENMKQQQKAMSQASSSAKAGKAAAAAPKVLATGLTVEENVNGSVTNAQANSWTTVNSKSSKKKNKGKAVVNGQGDSGDGVTAKLNNLSISSATAAPAKLATNNSGQPISTDPIKRLKNLRKKVIEIEKLKQKDPATLDKDQLDKIGRLHEILDAIEGLEAEIELS